MARSIGIGVIGMGWMGEVHSRSYRLVPDRFPNTPLIPRLVICSDNVEARAQRARDRFGFAQYSTDWRDVVAHPEVDVVVVAAPNFMHLEMVQAAAAAGKHVHCEKPVGREPAETAAIEQAARKAGVLSFVGYNYRWAPVVQYLHRLIREGKLGQLTHYRGRFLNMYASSPHSVLSWRFQWEYAGLGTLGDLMSHVLDMALWLVGPIRRVVSKRHTFITERPLAVPGEGTHFTVRQDGPKGPVTNEDYVSILAEFANGVQAVFESCRAIKGPECQMAFEVHGTQGAARWDFERMNELHLYLPEEGSAHPGYTRVVSRPDHPFHGAFNPGPAVGLGYEDLKVIEAYQFLQSIAAGRQGEPGLAEALAVAEVQDAVMRSWESGRWEEVRSLRRD